MHTKALSAVVCMKYLCSKRRDFTNGFRVYISKYYLLLLLLTFHKLMRTYKNFIDAGSNQ